MSEVATDATNTEPPDHSDVALAKQAIVPGVINGAINGKAFWLELQAADKFGHLAPDELVISPRGTP